MTALAKIRLAVVLACLAAYGTTLRSSDFIRDDRWLISTNPLLQGGWASLPALLTTGYWEAAQGFSAPVQEYRPLVSLSYFLHVATTGLSKAPMHAANVLLHASVCLLILEALRRKLAWEAAAAGSLIFALLPVHAEAVSYITSRSELLAALFMLAAWLALDPESKARPAWGYAAYSAALFSKEHAVLFPVFLALSDWTFHGLSPHTLKRRKIHAVLIACLLVYLGARAAVLGRVAHAGVPYFQDAPALITALTVARFMVLHYALPSLTGTGFCADFSRPLIPDSSPASAFSWLCLLGLVALLGTAAVRLLRERRPWAFWVLGPALFLAPTCHLLIPIDTLGAERLLYFPSLGLAALLGSLYARLPLRRGREIAFTALGLWYLGAVIIRNKAWSSELAFHETAIACNPVAASLRSSLGAYWLSRGDRDKGFALLRAAFALEPRSSHAHYNFARAHWEAGEFKESARHARAALDIDPGSSDGWVLLGLALEQLGKPSDSMACLEKALAIMPWHSPAHYNKARLHMAGRETTQAARHFKRFAELAPRDPDAARAQALAASLTR